MLKGEYEHTIDAKGRTVLPAKMREEVGEQFVITCGPNNCLFGYPLKAWEEFEGKLDSLPTVTNMQAANMVRFFMAKAADCEVDKQGRFPIPANLRQYARLTKDIVIIGNGKKFEIWDKEAWDQQFVGGFDELFAGLQEQGISI